jgi:hypothetical protein
MLSKRAAILRVVIPLSTSGKFTVHEHAGAPAHGAIEELHAELLAVLRMFAEVLFGAEEMRIAEDFDSRTDFTESLFDAIVPRFDNADSPRFESAEGDAQFACQGSGAMVNLPIFHTPIVRDQFIAKMAHGAEEDSSAGFVAPDVGRLLVDLGHPDLILAKVSPREDGRVTVELVAQDDEQVAHSHSREMRVKGDGASKNRRPRFFAAEAADE